MDRRQEVIIKSQTRKSRRDPSWPDSSKPRTQHHRARKSDTAAPCKIAADLPHRRGFGLAITPAPANRNVVVCNKILAFRKARLRRSGLVEQCQPSLARRNAQEMVSAHPAYGTVCQYPDRSGKISAPPNDAPKPSIPHFFQPFPIRCGHLQPLARLLLCSLLSAVGTNCEEVRDRGRLSSAGCR
jgi:hypothetical protein